MYREGQLFFCYVNAFSTLETAHDFSRWTTRSLAFL